MLRKDFLAVALSLTTTLVLAGCGKPAGEAGKAEHDATTTAHDDHEHGHAEEGPHHGHLIELGNEEFHGEIVHDDAAGKVTIYLLDGAAKASAAADGDQVLVSLVIQGQPKQFVLKAVDAGKRDQFESSEKELVEALDHDQEAKGRLNVTIGNKPYVGMIEHEKHADHDHKHK